MKYQTIISLILLPQLAPALGAAVTIPNNEAAELQKRNILSEWTTLWLMFIRLTIFAGHVGDKKAKALKAAGQGFKTAGKGVQAIGKEAKVVGKGAKIAGNGVKVAGSKGIKATGQGVKVVGQGIKNIEGEVQKTFRVDEDDDAYYEIFNELGNTIPTCVIGDCKNPHFMHEAMDWVKQAVNDVGVVIHDHPVATTALIIGVSILMAELISGGMLAPAALRAVGFGAKGPIRNSIAAAVQRVIHPVKLGSLFSRFQSAAMGGAAIGELKTLAHTVITGLIGVGVGGIVGGGGKPHGHLALGEWRTWELESRVDAPHNFTTNVTQFWGAPTYAGCVAYGRVEARAPLSLIPQDMDPLDACAQTPALIEGIGFKKPLGCMDEGSKKGVVGMWYVPTNATQCMPQWNGFRDEGCILYGRRRKFARLMGLNNHADWMGVCESTSAIINDKYYDRPSHCDDKGVFGIYGVFDIEDKQCECSCARG